MGKRNGKNEGPGKRKEGVAEEKEEKGGMGRPLRALSSLDFLSPTLNRGEGTGA